MVKMKIALSLFFLLFLSLGYSQKIDYSKFIGTKINAQLITRLDKPYFKEYGNDYLEVYVKINPFNRSIFIDGPEEVLFNVCLAKSEKELRSNFKNGLKVNLEQFKQQIVSEDTNRNFFLLKHKLTFNVEERELAIIKYTQYVDSIPAKDFSIQVLKIKNKWQAIKNDEYDEIEFVMFNVTADEFWGLTNNGKLDQKDKLISEQVLVQVQDEDGILNLTKLAFFIKEKKKQGKKEIFK